MNSYITSFLAFPLGLSLLYALISLILVLLVVVLVSSLTTPSFNVKGKHVVVTGGSSGIGLAVAQEYMKKGAFVTIVARDRKKLEAASKELAEAFDKHVQGKQAVVEVKGADRVSIISCDVGSSPEAVTKAFADVEHVDVLVNCAGTSVAGAFDQLEAHQFEHMLRTNVLGSVFPTRALLPKMKENAQKGGGGGRIVFVASQVAQVAIHGYTAYAASKWALRGLAEALQMEVKPFGIFVSVCYPPDTDTPGYKEEMKDKPSLTKKLSEAGEVFSPQKVAVDVVRLSNAGYFGISTGLDGWLLKQLHPGMTPLNNVWEVAQQVLFAPLCRLISIFYLASWDVECSKAAKEEQATKTKAKSE